MHITKIHMKICSISANIVSLSTPVSNSGTITEGHAHRPTMWRYDSHFVIEKPVPKRQGQDCGELVFILTSKKPETFAKKVRMKDWPANTSGYAREASWSQVLACQYFVCTCFVQALGFFNDYSHCFYEHVWVKLSEWTRGCHVSRFWVKLKNFEDGKIIQSNSMASLILIVVLQI